MLLLAVATQQCGAAPRSFTFRYERYEGGLNESPRQELCRLRRIPASRDLGGPSRHSRSAATAPRDLRCAVLPWPSHGDAGSGRRHGCHRSPHRERRRQWQSGRPGGQRRSFRTAASGGTSRHCDRKAAPAGFSTTGRAPPRPSPPSNREPPLCGREWCLVGSHRSAVDRHRVGHSVSSAAPHLPRSRHRQMVPLRRAANCCAARPTTIRACRSSYASPSAIVGISTPT